MRIQYRVNDATIHNETMQFTIDAANGRPEGSPSKKMITDSDELAFVYLFETNEGYNYIHFPKHVWPQMVEVLELDKQPVLKWNDELIGLPGFVEELTMLIFNIEGNDNYGEEFSTAVESGFNKILQA
ncbi:hypothetical protein [Sporosarcina sp. Te-1]|uniref:UPF0738 family protein n=1 Tax=Sporosarcina sp. Te-1 TaxID=2818390 RepID=UPI001A9E2325|nr:hypothetical protein [Sporosarcina sp. Te-1]QTD41230.1 hypothetical protein J3U78_21335 [Sporosarcina sp. Te-1]